MLKVTFTKSNKLWKCSLSRIIVGIFILGKNHILFLRYSIFAFACNPKSFAIVHPTSRTSCYEILTRMRGHTKICLVMFYNLSFETCMSYDTSCDTLVVPFTSIHNIQKITKNKSSVRDGRWWRTFNCSRL